MRKLMVVATVACFAAACSHATGRNDGNGGNGGGAGSGGGGNGGGGGSGGATLTVALPQALDGALWADPDVRS